MLDLSGAPPSWSEPHSDRAALLIYALAADAVVAFHAAFILFVVFGGFAVWRWPRLAWLQIPCATWGCLVELRGWICPLTWLEKSARALAGEAGYDSGYIEHYLTPLIYPGWLTPTLQLALGVGVILANGLAYGIFVWRWRRRRAGVI